MYNAISSLYSNPKSHVFLQQHCTEYFDCPLDVKQGDCLCPILFSIFINDLANEMEDTNIGEELRINDIASKVEVLYLMFCYTLMTLLS